MYSIKIEAHFSAAHNLRGYKGKCENLHGHNWKIEVCVATEILDKTGMVMDFRKLKIKLEKILGNLDHKYLNQLSYFRKFNPTSENIAKYIFACLRPQVSRIKSVTVWESDSCSATYEE